MTLKHEEFYSATVTEGTWHKNDNGNVSLGVRTIVQDGNETHEMTGKIFATANTAKPKLQEDGSEKPSFLENQLVAVGYSEEDAKIIALSAMNIGGLDSLVGTAQDLGGKACRVKIEDWDYNGKSGQKIGMYSRGARKVDMSALSGLLGANEAESNLGDETFEASEDIPF